MRRSFLFLMIAWLLLSSRAAYSDDDVVRRELVFGGKLGLNAVGLGGDDADGVALKTTHKASGTVGGFAALYLHELIAVQPELLFVMKGAGREAYGRDRGAINLNYMEVPLLFHGRYPVLKNLDIHGLLGPALSILINAEIENERGESFDLNEKTTAIDVGVIIGLGATWYVSQTNALVVEARYDLGVRSIDRDGNDVKNRAFTLMIGYQWGRAPR